MNIFKVQRFVVGSDRYNGQSVFQAKGGNFKKNFLICVLHFTEVEKEPKPVKKKVEEEKIIKDTVSCSSY